MAKGDFREAVIATLPASNAGEFAEVAVTITGTLAADIALVSITSADRPVTQTGDSFNVYVSNVRENTVTVKANKPQTPEVKVVISVIKSA